MLSHSKDGIAESLTKLANDVEEKIAIQNFRDIRCYMADKPVQDLVREAAYDHIVTLATRPEFSSEVFLQVMKQLTSNPSPRSCMLGWKLLVSICQMVRADDKFMPFLTAFLEKATTLSDTNQAHAAKCCLQGLEARRLPVLRGYIWKQNPSSLMKRWKKRFFVLGNHQLFWWTSVKDAARPESARPGGGPFCLGSIDFLQEQVQVEAVGETSFSLKPTNGWSEKFAKAQKHDYLFECKDTENIRSIWMEAIKEHLRYGDRFRGHRGFNFFRGLSDLSAA